MSKSSGLEGPVRKLLDANAWLRSMADEYRQIAETLTESRDGLMSVVHELRTTSAELTGKLHGVLEAKFYAETLFAECELRVISLDREGRLRAYTPRAMDLFSLSEQTIGTQIGQIASQFEQEHFENDVATVLRDLVPVQREIETRDGCSLLLSVRPFTTPDRLVAGTVLNFKDLATHRRTDSALKDSEARLQHLSEAFSAQLAIIGDLEALRRRDGVLHDSEERLRKFGEASQDVLWIRDAESLQWEYLTPAFEAIYGLERAVALRGDNMVRWLDLIVPEDREQAASNINRVRLGEWVTFEYRIRRPVDGQVRWLRNTDFPIKNAEGKVIRIGGIGHDITAMKDIAAALAEAGRRQRALLEGIPQLVWRAVEDGRWTWASPQWVEYTGQAEADSHDWGWLEPVHPDDREAARMQWADADDSGQLEVEWRLHHAQDDSYRWFHTRAVPVRDHRGQIVEWLGTSTEVDQLRTLQEQQSVLVAELQHRTRNLMSIVRTMAEKTGRSSKTLEDFRSRFEDRLDALARVQSLLSRLNEHDRVTFDELIESELSAMDGSAERITLSGPTGVRLRSSSVQILAMAVHELATNAMKYGALKQEGARLVIRWSLDRPVAQDPPWLNIEWHESGVRMPLAGAVASGGGQGRELIERALPYQLNAKTRFDMRADGIHCVISVPVSDADGPAHG